MFLSSSAALVLHYRVCRIHHQAWESDGCSHTVAGSMLGKEIRRRRKALGWTQQRLAEEADLSPHYLSEVETSKRDPSVSTVQALAKAMKITPAHLLGGVEGLKPAGIEAAKLFQKLPEPAQEVVLQLMRLLARKR